ncbi:P-loop containing nucleoside triphosphate hydrolase protein [Sistotremastrum suecicum HHB10207 ss-3]|uniref:Kinesin-like protein n=1 Tax=Sistotremastrum suecicum HHB10207 ss-3 TaxID=1314776 RepID=A0A166GP67_9AGAM|nr:P-loop containing nucleoside triphosphate hydrolase protein [Sistotremastrum suecicum HHB10207 ss-3]
MSLSSQNITANQHLYRALLTQWENTQPPARGFESSVDTASRREDKDVIVAFRTRPPLERELIRFESEKSPASDAESDVSEPVTVENFKAGINVISAEPGVMVAHVPGMKWNGPTLTQKTFEADLAFGPQITNDEIYQRTVQAHDMINLALEGGVSCIMAYGQTGAGKTYTMESLEHLIARDLFPATEKTSARLLDSTQDARKNEDGATNIFEFSVTFLELLGKTAYDLLEQGYNPDDDTSPRKPVDIHEDKAGFVRPRLVETHVTSSEELNSLITNALAHRRVSATARNAQSSRSHAVLTIRAHNTLIPHADDGELILVDLAGSERYDDSKAHSKLLMDQSRENNKSLANLKECVRTRAKSGLEATAFVHIPFRTNKLTLLLKSIFDLESTRLSKTIVIAHISPHLQDTPHSVNTLSYASPFRVDVPKSRGTPVMNKDDPRTWDHDYTIEFLTKEFEKRSLARAKAGHQAQAKQAALKGKKIRPFDDTIKYPMAIDPVKLCPPPKTGKHLARMYTAEWIEACFKAQIPENLERTSAHDVVKTAAMESYGAFNYLLLTARTKTRNSVMKTRKKAAADEIYGTSARPRAMSLVNCILYSFTSRCISLPCSQR